VERHPNTQPPYSTLAGLFAASAARRPCAPAVRDAETRLTYADLDACSGQLASLLTTLGIEPEDRVGLYMERGVEVVVGILGIVKAGAAYLPVDTRYPNARRDLMLTSGGIKALVTQSSLRDRLVGSSFEVIEWQSGSVPTAPERPTCPAQPENAACVLYTSGSTGAPKAILLEHRNLVAFATNPSLPRLTPEDRVAQVGSISFDATTLEVWWTLAAGAEIVVLSTVADLVATDLQRELRRRRVTAMLVPSAALNFIVREDRETFSSLRILYAGGDVLLPATCHDLLASGFKGHLLNLYGPAECTTACAAYEIMELPHKATTVPIGKSLEGYSLHVLGVDLHPVPPGSPGELYVGGRGVGRGYLSRPGLTALRFIPDPFSGDGGRLYATGDLVRQNDQDDLEFLGRIDEQAKIRGYRTEPGEVQRALCQHGDVREAAVLAVGEAGEKRLVAFLVPTQEQVSLRDLRGFLRETVPDYMIPTEFVVLSAIPTDAHGKRDREALAQLLAARAHQRAEYVAPHNEVERYLSVLWEELLVTERIGMLDDFFSLGGHSLLAVKARTAIEQSLGVKLEFELLFENSILQDLARVVEQALMEVPIR
jgi:amino acid adenylation domain-containing protein